VEVALEAGSMRIGSWVKVSSSSMVVSGGLVCLLLIPENVWWVFLISTELSSLESPTVENAWFLECFRRAVVASSPSLGNN
jgi:hypothetical protein